MWRIWFLIWYLPKVFHSVLNSWLGVVLVATATDSPRKIYYLQWERFESFRNAASKKV